MKLCLNCNKEFEPKKPHGKFCSANCRVAYNRKNPQKPIPVSPCMREMFNSIMAGINAINAKNGQPEAFGFVGEIKRDAGAVLSYNELVDMIEAATSSTELHKAWKEVEKNKSLAGWQLKQLNNLKELQRTKIEF